MLRLDDAIEYYRSDKKQMTIELVCEETHSIEDILEVENILYI